MTTPEKIYHLQIDGQEAEADATTLMFVLGRIAIMLSEETEEIWMAHVNPDDLMSDDTYFRCDRHGAIIRMGEIPVVPDLERSLLNLAMDKHR